MERSIVTTTPEGGGPILAWIAAIGLHALAGLVGLSWTEAPRALAAPRETVVFVSLIESQPAPADARRSARDTAPPSASPPAAVDFAPPPSVWDASISKRGAGERVLSAPENLGPETLDPAAPNSGADRFSISPQEADLGAILAGLSRCRTAEGTRRADCFALGEALAPSSSHAAFDDPTPGDVLSDPRFAGLDREAIRVALGLQRRFAWNEPTVKTTGARLRSLSGAFGGELAPAHPDAVDPGFGD